MGCRLDVFEFEPILQKNYPIDNVALAPQAGTATIECRIEMAQAVAQKYQLFLQNDARINRVN